MNRYIVLAALTAVVLGGTSSALAQQVAAPYTSATRYNTAGQVTGTLSPDPDGIGTGTLGHPATRNTYFTSGPSIGLLEKTEVGQLSGWFNEQTAPAAWTSFDVFQTRVFQYDNQGRKIAERVIGRDDVTVESLIQYSYDSWDRVVCRVVRMNPAAFGSPPTDACQLGSEGIHGPDRITKYTYDGFDQVLTEQRAFATPIAQTYVTNTYFGRGVLQSQTDANGNKTDLRYDSNWRLNKRVYPSAFSTGNVNENDYNQYTYDKNGNVEVERKRNGATITNAYDANNRLSFKNLSDNTYSSDIAYDYDLRGLTRSACFSSNAADIDCDTAPDGEGETNVFDGFGNLTARISSYDGYVRGLTYQYDLEGNRTRITHPDGVYFSYNRDGLNRTCTLGENAAAPACNTTDPNAYLVMHYSSEGRRADITRAGGSVTSYATDNALRMQSFSQDFAVSANDLTNGFGYNPASQIRSLTQSNAQYNYTEAQNRTGSYGVNGLNQYTQIDGATVSYDPKGNLTADGTGYVYTYDMENRLVATGGTKAATLAYDPMGRLSRYVVDGTTRHFHYDGDALVGMYSNGALDYRYVHGDQVDEPLVQYAGASVGSGNRRYVYADHQGSVIALGDSTGAVTQVNSYDAYGVPKSTNNGWFGYTGQVWLAQIDLNYYKARIYSPKLGRFLQTDPIFYRDGMNMYAYVGGDPVNRVDPNGLQGYELPELKIDPVNSSPVLPLTEAINNLDKDTKSLPLDQREKVLVSLDGQLNKAKDEVQAQLDAIHSGAVSNEPSTDYPGTSNKGALEVQMGTLDNAISHVQDALADTHRKMDNLTGGHNPSEANDLIPARIDINLAPSPGGPDAYNATIVLITP